jgi:hypothetical protein
MRAESRQVVIFTTSSTSMRPVPGDPRLIRPPKLHRVVQLRLKKGLCKRYEESLASTY